MRYEGDRYKDTACEEIANLYGGVVVEQSAEAVKEEVMRLTGVRE